MAPTVSHVVADAGAFIRNAPLRDIAETVYTVPEVIAESCDKKTRARFKTLPIEIKFKEPSSEALALVSAFAKKTGDFRSLSAVDLKVLALTYDLEKQFKGTDHINTEPKSNGAEWQVGQSSIQVGFGHLNKELKEGQLIPSSAIEDGDDEKEKADDDDAPVEMSKDPITEKEQTETAGESEMKSSLEENMDQGDEAEEEEEEEEDSDEDGWITPANIDAVKRAMGVETASSGQMIAVGCLTTDFAMQNVLIQMNLSVVSIDGYLIKSVKSFVLRCFGCFKITKDTSKVFCPHCGNKTLRRLTASINEDGTLKYHLSKNFKISTRGTKFSLPKPMGGKYAQNPILFEDQPVPQQRISKKAMQKFDVMSDDLFQGYGPFKTNDVHSKSSQLGFLNHKTPYWAKRNPNEGNRRRKKK